jgi:hypothetical protein
MTEPKTAVPADEPRQPVLASPELQEVTCFRRALEIAEQDGLGVSRVDLQRIESMWSIDDGDRTSMGFVLALQDGRRAYLEYLFDFADDEDEIDLQPMNDERYPALEGGGVEWTDDVGELNRLLMS